MANIWMFILMVVIVAKSSIGGRYKSCSEGCCRREFCAYDEICYPLTRCRYGCPDGQCVDNGTDKECVPYELCQSRYDCGAGTVCTMHYNLGYRTCQYNLDIGSTLCDKRRKRADIPTEDNSAWSRLMRNLKRGLDE